MIATVPSYPLALLAGLVSFLSPCVFPLVPAYAAYLSGRAGEAVATEGPGAALARPSRVPVITNGIAFVAGFSIVFVAFYYVFQALRISVFVDHQQLIDSIAGAMVLVLALQTFGVIRLGFLMRDRRLHVTPAAGAVGSLLLGLTFAAGWSPCLGPQLGAILTVATVQHGFGGLPFMLVYCLGLAIPFLVVAVLCDRLQGTIRTVNRHMSVINIVSGALLVVFGVLLITGSLTTLSQLSFQSPFDL